MATFTYPTEKINRKYFAMSSPTNAPFGASDLARPHCTVVPFPPGNELRNPMLQQQIRRRIERACLPFFKGSEYLVLAHIMDQTISAGRPKWGFSYAKIARGDGHHTKGVGMTRRQVIRLVASLEALGVIGVERNLHGVAITLNISWVPGPQTLTASQRRARERRPDSELQLLRSDTQVTTQPVRSDMEVTGVVTSVSPIEVEAAKGEAKNIKEEALFPEGREAAPSGAGVPSLVPRFRKRPIASAAALPVPAQGWPEKKDCPPIAAAPPALKIVPKAVGAVDPGPEWEEEERPAQPAPEPIKVEVPPPAPIVTERKPAARPVMQAASLEKTWSAAYDATFVGNRLAGPYQAWPAKDHHKVRSALIGGWAGSAQELHDFVAWAVRNWEATIALHFAWMKQPPAPAFPDVGFFVGQRARFLAAYRNRNRDQFIDRLPEGERRRFLELTTREGKTREEAQMVIAQERFDRDGREEHARQRAVLLMREEKLKATESRIRRAELRANPPGWMKRGAAFGSPVPPEEAATWRQSSAAAHRPTPYAGITAARKRLAEVERGRQQFEPGFNTSSQDG